MNKSDLKRNLPMLKGPLARLGYDWWWHNFTAWNRRTGQPKSFFIEYYYCNPALAAEAPVLGQLPENKQQKRRPSYAMIKVGHWGEGAQQIHNFYPHSQVKMQAETLDLDIGGNRLTETALTGRCSLTQAEAEAHPEYLSGWGSMSWNLQVRKQIAFHVGYGASAFFRWLNAFEMFWHAEGIKTEFSGEVVLNGEVYDVFPERSFGYSDKNWGTDFTSPWLWISSCRLTSLRTGKLLKHSALELGGGQPKVFGLSLGRRILGSLVYEGQTFAWNFAHFWRRSRIDFAFRETDTTCHWEVTATNAKAKMILNLECPKAEMLLVNYEAPNGRKRHNRLWNGGTGRGELQIFTGRPGHWSELDRLSVENAGCEYGEYDRE